MVKSCVAPSVYTNQLSKTEFFIHRWKLPESPLTIHESGYDSLNWGGKTLGLCMRAHISTFRISIICNITKDSQLHVICLNLCTLFTQVNTFYYQWNISIDTFYAFICDFFSAPLVFSIWFCLSRLSITRDKITSQPLSHFVAPNRAFTLKHWAIETLNADTYSSIQIIIQTTNQQTNWWSPF